jgi:hypothetical protein
MSVLKSELKMLVTNEVGVRVDDALESAKREISTIEGRQAAFLEGAKAVEALASSVDRDVEDGQYGLEEAARIKRYITRAGLALSNLSQQASNFRTMQLGKIAGLDMAIQMLKGIMDSEKAKIEQVQAKAQALAQSALPSQGATTTPSGLVEREAPRSLKEIRLAEEAAADAAPSAPQPEGTPPESVDQQAVPDEQGADDGDLKRRKRPEKKRATDPR